VSFRSVPRILELFRTRARLGIGWVPHFTSVINWTLRVGLGLLEQVELVDTPWLAIIDHSIDIGTKKALVVLRVPLDALSRRGTAIQLEDCQCVGLRIAETVNGETVARHLQEIFMRSGTPAAITKDCDATLQKGVRLWMAEAQVVVPSTLTITDPDMLKIADPPDAQLFMDRWVSSSILVLKNSLVIAPQAVSAGSGVSAA
jgi:hypothetical protein